MVIRNVLLKMSLTSIPPFNSVSIYREGVCTEIPTVTPTT